MTTFFLLPTIFSCLNARAEGSIADRFGFGGTLRLKKEVKVEPNQRRQFLFSDEKLGVHCGIIMADGEPGGWIVRKNRELSIREGSYMEKHTSENEIGAAVRLNDSNIRVVFCLFKEHSHWTHKLANGLPELNEGSLTVLSKIFDIRIPEANIEVRERQKQQFGPALPPPAARVAQELPLNISVSPEVLSGVVY